MRSSVLLPILLASLLGACRRDDPTAATTGTGSRDTAAASLVTSVAVVAPVDAAQHLAKLVVLETGEPTTAALALDEGGGRRTLSFPGEHTEHRLPVLGLPPGTHDVEWEVRAATGEVASGTVAVSIAPVDDVDLPEVGVDGDPAATEPGYTLMAMWSERTGRAAAYAADGRLAWLLELPAPPKAATFTEHGLVGMIVDGVGTLRSVRGDPPVTYGVEGTGSHYGLEARLHHDLLPQPDGSFWSLQSRAFDVDAFPVSPGALGVFEPATLSDDLVVHVSAEGEVLGRWSMVELLDSRRVGYGSHDLDELGFDWGHANALLVLDGGERVVVSLRHQDAIVSLDTQANEVEWILANPDGWSPPLDGLRLQPVGEVTWPYHGHGVKIVGDLLYVFDNGNAHRTTPYSRSPEPGPAYSRMVAYRIDPEARTVEQVWEAIDPDRMYSLGMGNVQPLPATGHVLGTYPFQVGLGGVANDEAGRGMFATRVVELDPVDGSFVWGMSLWSSADDAAEGWLVDRATRIPSLYEGIATETWTPSPSGG